MVTTNDKALWSRMWSHKDHGKSWNAIYERDHPQGFRWVHESFGTNWRMTEMQGAIGRVQLKHLSDWNAKRLANANEIWRVARGLKGLRVPELTCFGCEGDCNYYNGCVHAAYKCYVFVDGSEYDRDKILSGIIGRGVPCFPGTCSEYILEKAFEGTAFRPKKRLPNAKKLGETSLMFLCHPTLTKDEIKMMCDVLIEVVSDHFS